MIEMIERIEVIFRTLGWLLFGSGVNLWLDEQYEKVCWLLFIASLCLGLAGFIAPAINLYD